MKKVIIIITILMLNLLLLFLLRAAHQVVNMKDIKINNETLDGNKDIHYPSISNHEIDDYIKEEIIKLSNILKLNYPTAKVVIDFNAAAEQEVVNYKFMVNVYENDSLVQDFIRTYNFSSKEEKQLIIDDETFLKDYLWIINDQLTSHRLSLNQNDLKYLRYLISPDEIKFIIPSIITRKNEIDIITPNYGSKHIELTTVSKQKKKYVALTFDDGPSRYTKNVVDLLGQYHIKATFFLLGQRVFLYQEMVKYIFSNHHEIGNHSYDHSDFSKLTGEEIEEQIIQTEEMIYSVIKSYPRIFRLPYGSYNKELLSNIKYPIIMWDVDSNDWKSYTDFEIVQLILPQVTDGSVILFHDLSKFRKEALTTIIETLLNENYEFVTISTLFGFHHEENVKNGKIYYWK